MPEIKCQPQVSLAGRSAWVVQRMLRYRGTSDAEVARWIIDRWIDGEGREYLRSYGIDLLDYPQDEEDVLPFTGTRG